MFNSPEVFFFFYKKKSAGKIWRKVEGKKVLSEIKKKWHFYQKEWYYLEKEPNFSNDESSQLNMQNLAIQPNLLIIFIYQVA